MTDQKTKKLINAYNALVQEHEQKYKNARMLRCPYYRINLATLKKFSPAHKKIFADIIKQSITKQSPWELWDKVLRDADYKIKPKAKAIRGVNFKISKSLYTKLVDADSLFRFCNNKGLDLPKSHFKWMLDQNLVKPIKIISGKKLYSRYQLMILDYIVKVKKESLEYPNPTFFFGRQIKIEKKLIDSPGLVKTESVYWQDHILLNKERILENGEDLKLLILFLEAIDNLGYLIWDKAMKEFHKLKRKYPQEQKYKLKDIFKGIKDESFGYYAPTFKSKFKQLPTNNIKVWSHNILPALAIRHNPLLQSCNKWPTLLKIFDTEENIAQTIFRKGNDIKLANFHIHIIQKLNDYLKITGAKDIKPIEDLVSRTSINQERRCQICSEAFVPNLERKGGKKQILCGKNGCKQEWDKIRQKKYRDKKR
jgi:hypothetical protein